MFFPSSVRKAPVSRSAIAQGAAAALVSFAALAEEPPMLDPVVVTATRTSSSWQTAPVGATVITAQQIASSGVNDANEAIRKLAGVASRPDLNNGRELSLDLRGYGETAASNMVVLVDGIRVSENEIASARLSAIPLSQIERIEIVRGGASVLWGEGASAGVINVILKDKAATGKRARLLASIESFNGREVGADGSWGRDSWSLDASVRRLRTDGYRDNSAYAQDVGSLGLQWAENGLHARVRVQQEAQNSGMPGSLTFAQFSANRRQTTSPDNWANVEETRYSGNVGYENGAWSIDLDLGTRDRTSSYEYVSPGSSPTTSKSRQTQLTPRISYEGDVANVSTRTQVGLDFESWRFTKNIGAATEDGSQSNHAAFFQSDWSLPTRTRMVFGARHENIEKSDNYPGTSYDSPVTYTRPDSLKAHELSLSQGLTDELNVYGRTATSYRLPNIDENRSTTALAALRPQRNRDLEVGIKWNQKAQSATVRWFKQRTTDEIAYDPISNTNTNRDPISRSGIEVEGHLQPLDRLQLLASWQHLTAKYVGGANAGMEPVLVAPFSATLRATYSLDDRQSVSLGMQYVGPMRFGDDSSNICSSRLPSARPIDATYRWSDQLWTVVLAGTNLADQHGYSYAYSCTTGYLYPDPGRALKLTVSRSF